MLVVLLLSIAIFVATSEGQFTSSCKDLDTNACVLFSKASPNLCSDQTFSTGTCRRFCGNCPPECFTCPTPVLDPNRCSTTSSCSAGETCMLKQFTGSDGHEEFIMRCEDKTLCEGLLHGFYNVPVGRRSMTSGKNGEWNGPSKRDVSLSLKCCDTDFCNFPNISTTTSIATSPGPFPHGCNRDIVFVLNDSGSVGSSNFRHALDFVKEIVRQLDIGPTLAQVAMLTFSTRAVINWHLNRYTTKPDVLAAVDNVRYQGGVTHTDDALKTVRDQVLTQANGDRQLAKNVVIVLTDGQSNDKVETIKEAHNLHLRSDDVISIAIGTGINSEEIKAIATDNHHVFDLRTYSALNTIFSNLMQIICNA